MSQSLLFFQPITNLVWNRCGSTHSPLKKRGDWAELTLAKTSGTVTGGREKNWPIADRHVTSNDPRILCKS